MRIDPRNFGNVNDLLKTGRREAVNNKPGKVEIPKVRENNLTRKNDTVKLSLDSRKDLREKRVEEIRNQIQSGSYNVDSRKVI
ncbi:MAG: flagellar biosynthesis anti-sigma factor FlgM, partial [candidate division WOR-3 bacterium]